MMPGAVSDAPALEVRCRSCGEAGLEPVLSLGRMPLANALLTAEDLNRPEPRYPLDLVFCPACTLVQITETVPPELLFGEYLYFSSFSDTLLRHAEALVQRMTADRHLNGHSLVVEIASNDGYLLQFYQRRGVPVLGIEPARNVAAEAERRGVPTLCAFFGETLARQLRAEGRAADVLHAHNVLAHVADLNGFVAGMAELLAEDGMAVIEAPYVKDMVERCEFDTIYHEHLCYFSVAALARLFARHGLTIRSVEQVPIHGGSLRVFAGRRRPADSTAAALLAAEREWAASAEFYARFGGRVRRLQAELRELLHGLRAQGRRIAAYGAAAKGTVLLNALALDPGVIEFVADRSPHKQGRYVPGVRIPIRPPGALLESAPDYVLLLAWNLAEEVMAQQAEYRRRGGRFILPIPQPTILPA